MKRIIAVIIMLTPMLALGQWNTATNPPHISYSAGNVGIGTSNPQTKLDINGSGTVGLNVSGNNSTFVGSDINISRSSTATGVGQGATLQFNDIGSAGYNLIQGSSEGLQIFNNYASGGWIERMRISGNGNVGIGTSTPVAKLTLGAYTGTMTSSNGIALGGDQNNIEFLNSSYGNGFGAKLYGLDQGNGLTSFRIAVRGNSTTWTDALFIHAGTNGVSGGNTGYVGIGTNNPDAKLAVKGTVHAEEVKVDLNVPGPDYVFEENYHLPSLTETEAYIKTHKHLPEVPSAKEMEANGINLSEMNMLLLKKVEELTLYMIEMKKSNDELKENNNVMRRELDELKRR